MTTGNDPLGLVGTTIAGKYDVERLVGTGSFGTVYRAIHNVWKRPVAIKVFVSMSGLRVEQRERLVDIFIQESAVLGELSERSAAICQARDVGSLHSEDGRETPYMVLEWLEGKTLEQVLADEKAAGLAVRTIEEAISLIEPAAVALALAHRKGIVHRDVKPANVFVLGDARGDFTIKLLDFGIAKVVQDMRDLDEAYARSKGILSSFTPAYAAPEQLAPATGAIGPWTDVFALALIVIEVVTRVRALRGNDATQLVSSATDESRRPTPRAFGVAVSDAVEDVLRRAIAVKPEARFQSIGEFWNALRGAVGLEPLGGVIESQRSLPIPAGPEPARSNTARIVVKGETSAPTAETQLSPESLPSEQASGSTAKLFAMTGIGVVAAAIALVAGVWFVAIRGKDEIAPVDGQVADTLLASATPPPPKPEAKCAEGMIRIPGGKFFMGSDDKTDLPDERPAHQVTLSPYCIDKFEVTVARYKECVDRGECKPAPKGNEWPQISARERKIYDPLCNTQDSEARANYPINCVNWELATAFCTARGGRLPTEAEWEFATRGSDGRKYPWGDDAPTGERLNACGKECLAWGKKTGEEVEAMYPTDDGFATVAPVGSFPKGASPFGVQDVVGNVWEWVSDWYALYRAEEVTDPKGPSKGTERVMRGGAWNGSDAAWVRPTFRFKVPPTFRSHGIGFRCVHELPSTDR